MTRNVLSYYMKEIQKAFIELNQGIAGLKDRTKLVVFDRAKLKKKANFQHNI